MNLFCRISDIVTANLNDLVDRCEDPEKMLNQAVREMESAISAAMDGAAKVLANEKLLQRRLRDEEAQAERWRSTAEDAVRRGDDEAARHALGRRADHAAVAAALTDQLDATRKTSRRLRRQIDAMRVRLSEARRRLISLSARRHAAQAQRRLVRTLGAVPFEDAAFHRFERLAAHVEQLEAEAEALAELNGEEVEDTSRADVEDELRALKAACER